MPDGYILDAASAPAPVGSPTDVSSSNYQIKYSGKARVLSYERDYTLGRGGNVQFRTDSYQALRRLLGRIHRSDTHQLMIKPKLAIAVVDPTSAPTTP